MMSDATVPPLTAHIAGSVSGESPAALLWNDARLERRLTLLLALMARCALDPDAFAKHSLAHIMKDQLATGDARERYLAGEGLRELATGDARERYLAGEGLRELATGDARERYLTGEGGGN